MNVTFDQTGHGERAFEIDHLRRRTDVGLDLRRGSDGGDGVAADRQRLGRRPRLVDRDDLAAAQHEVGRPDGGARLRADAGASRGDEHQLRST
jgi:hypothetical protein